MTPIPTIGTYRGVPLHDHQDAERLKIVRADIDHAMSLSAVDSLYDFACDQSRAPEARLLSAEKVHSLWMIASEMRARRPGLELDVLDAHVAGLDSALWRSREVYGVIPDSSPPAIRRKVPIPDNDE